VRTTVGNDGLDTPMLFDTINVNVKIAHHSFRDISGLSHEDTLEAIGKTFVESQGRDM
jgi:hypothetical protein